MFRGRNGSRHLSVVALAAVLALACVPPASAQKLLAALPLVDNHMLNGPGTHVLVQSWYPRTAADTDERLDVYVFTVATGVWQLVPRLGLVGRPEAVDNASIELLSLSDDGRYLAYVTTVALPFRPLEPPVLARYDLTTGARIVVRDARHDAFRSPVMSRDGSTFAWLGDRNAVIVGKVGQRPLTVGEACPPFDPGVCERGPMLTADGSRVLFVPGPSSAIEAGTHLEVFDIPTVRRTIHPEFAPRASDMTTTADGGHVFATGIDGNTVFDLSRRRVDRVSPNSIAAPATISDDGRYVLFGNGNVFDRHASFLLASGGSWSFGLSADGRRILVRLDGAVALLDLDGDGDGMFDPWETVYTLDPTSANDGDLDPDGDGVSNRDEYVRGSHPHGVHRRYFAEGVSSSFFDTAVYVHGTGPIVTPHPRPITVTFIGDDGVAASRTLRQQLSIFGDTSVAVPPAALGSRPYAIVVESENPFAAERVTTWGDGALLGAHASSGAAAPDYFWMFAEGTTRGGMQVFYLLSNPGDADAQVWMNNYCAEEFAGSRSYTVPARGRLTLWMNQQGAPLDAAECGAHVASDRPIVAERSMYLLENGRFTAGTSTTGMPSSEGVPQTWYFAAGATADPFDMFLTLVNPAPTEACFVEVTYTRPDTAPLTRTHYLPGLARRTIWVDQEDPHLAQAGAVATRVHCPTGPIYVERAMWWRAPDAATWAEGHVERGSLETATAWAMAHVPESASLSILNTSGSAGLGRVTLYAANGVGAADATIPLPPGLTVVRPIDLWPALPPARYSATVRSLESGGAPAVPLVVERTSYTPDMSVGTTVLGTPIP